MSRQLKPNELIELFKIYETSNLQNVWIKYADYRETFKFVGNVLMTTNKILTKN